MAHEVISATSLLVEMGAELLDSNDDFVEDISDVFVAGEITRDSDSTVHGSARFTLAEAFNWESQRIKPYITLTDELTGNSETFNLGVYLPETPSRKVGESPQVYEVEAYDKLVIPNTPIGSTYRVAAGTGYVAKVEEILGTTLGQAHNISQTEAAKTLPSDRVWELDEKHTWLFVVNELLSAIGYRTLHVDRDGTFVSEPWLSPTVRTPVWDYDTDSEETVVLQGGLEEETDLWPIPNKWVFVRDDPDPDLPLPTEGNGIYTVTNQSDGITSIDARGRTKTRVVRLDAADHESLVAQGDRIVEEDKQPVSEVRLRSQINPLHWHNEVVRVTAPQVGLSSTRFAELSWTLTLPAGPMEHTLRRAS